MPRPRHKRCVDPAAPDRGSLRRWTPCAPYDVAHGVVPWVTPRNPREGAPPCANRGDALDGPPISEDDYEVTLHEERPVVEKEAVPVERVRLEKETVTEQQTVNKDVRKEKIETDGDELSDGRTGR